jgi:hypothetical protein
MRKEIIVSIIISLGILLVSYFKGNTSSPMAGEKAVLVKLNNWKSFLNLNKDSVPDDVLLINVAFDKALTDYSEDGMPIGQFTITDRQKLLQFLTKARKANNYKFIMMDVIFERGIETEYDSILFHTIASMQRIVIPVHKDAPLQDSILYAKAANGDYSITHDETDFVRFQFMHDDIPSMPLVIYKANTGFDITRKGPFYFSDGHLCSNGLTLKLPVRISGAYMNKNDGSDESNQRERSYIYMGADVLGVDSIIPVADQIADKIIVIGDFNTDVHRTYAGKQPGSVICLNAYYALLRGEHLISYTFTIFLFIVYVIISLLLLNGKTLDTFVSNPLLKVASSFFTYTIVFTFIAMVVYATPLGIVYNPVLPTTVFTFLGLLIGGLKKIT